MSVNPPKIECTNFGHKEKIDLLHEISTEIGELLNNEKNNDIKCGIRSCLEIIYKKKNHINNKNGN